MVLRDPTHLTMSLFLSVMVQACAPYLGDDVTTDMTPISSVDGGETPDLDGAMARRDGARYRPEDAAIQDEGAVDSSMVMDLEVQEDVRPMPIVDQGVKDDAGAGPGPEDWGPCSVAGSPGHCLPTSECDHDHVSVPGHCPGPAEIQCCVVADAPGFECDPDVHLRQGNRVSPPGEGDCPAGMVAMEGFCIDRYEAVLEDEDGIWSPYHNPGDRPLRAASYPDVIPQGYINGIQAEAACRLAGKRLCTDAEWLRACQGPTGWTYPYGPDRQPGSCNDARARHPAVELFPNAANPFALIQNSCINQLPNGLASTGEHPNCESSDGVFDMMGNLHEWTADPTGTFRGGFYVDTVRNGPGCLYRTGAHDRSHWDYSTGFRCCASP